MYYKILNKNGYREYCKGIHEKIQPGFLGKKEYSKF